MDIYINLGSVFYDKENIINALAHFNLARAITIVGDKIEAAKLYQIAQDINKVTNEKVEHHCNPHIPIIVVGAQNTPSY